MAENKLKRPTKKSFHVFSFDNTEEKVVVRLEGEKSQDAIYEINCVSTSIRITSYPQFKA